MADERSAGEIPEPPWWRPAGAGAPARDRLSRDLIVDTALRILDGEGVAAVTIRRLARELDTGPASLYWHITGKEQLLELVYDRILGEIDFPAPDPARWADQIRAVAHSSYDVFVAHQDAALLSLGSVPFGPNGLRMIEWMLAVLRGAGVRDDLAAFFGDLLGRFIDASVLEEVRARQHVDPEAAAALPAYLASLPADRFPNLRSLASAMSGGPDGTPWDDPRSRFDLGLDLLLAGLAVHVPSG